ncbi:MAG TPA: ribokinase [Jatrophihabitantaceae bacterium]|jgi:ribokinase
MTRIAVLGSANMDLVVTVDRAPSLGETVTGSSFRTIPGGKGANQALAAARAGGDVRFLGAVGGDPYGEQIRVLLDEAGIDVSGLVTVAEPTGTAHITVDATGANSIIVVPGANGTVHTLTDAHRHAIADVDTLLLQLELPLSVVVEATAFARAQGVTTILTPAPVRPLPDDLIDNVDLLVPNEHEAAALGRPRHDLLTTLGEAGARYDRPGADPLTVPAFKVSAVDTTAAGDTFVGAFAVARDESADLAAALRWASAAAALSVQRFGASAAMPWREEIEAFLRENPPC